MFLFILQDILPSRHLQVDYIMKRKILVFLIVLTLILAIPSWNHKVKLFSSRRSLLGTPTSPYREHNSIFITSNAFFTIQAVSEGWPGNGTSFNPYIIENLNITTSLESLITIHNTDVYFQIRDNLLIHDTTQSSYEHGGIWFNNVKNGMIINNEIRNSNSGILITESTNITITGNKIINNTYTGMGLFLLTGSTITNNTIRDNQAAIELSGSHNIISHNNISDNLEGIVVNQPTPVASVGFTDNNVINYNIITNNLQNGIDMLATNNIIQNNIIQNNNDNGIYLSGSDNLISNNSLFNNRFYGVRITSHIANILENPAPSGNVIRWNDFIGNTVKILGAGGQARDYGSDNTFEYNYFSDHHNTDANSDHIADTPYNIDGDANNKDFKPLIIPNNPDATSWVISLPISRPIPSYGVTSFLAGFVVLNMFVQRKKSLK